MTRASSFSFRILGSIVILGKACDLIELHQQQSTRHQQPPTPARAVTPAALPSFPRGSTASPLTASTGAASVASERKSRLGSAVQDLLREEAAKERQRGMTRKTSGDATGEQIAPSSSNATREEQTGREENVHSGTRRRRPRRNGDSRQSDGDETGGGGSGRDAPTTRGEERVVDAPADGEGLRGSRVGRKKSDEVEALPSSSPGSSSGTLPDLLLASAGEEMAGAAVVVEGASRAPGDGSVIEDNEATPSSPSSSTTALSTPFRSSTAGQSSSSAVQADDDDIPLVRRSLSSPDFLHDEGQDDWPPKMEYGDSSSSSDEDEEAVNRAAVKAELLSFAARPLGAAKSEPRPTGQRKPLEESVSSSGSPLRMVAVQQAHFARRRIFSGGPELWKQLGQQ